MKITKKDILIAVLIFLAGGLICGGLVWRFKPAPAGNVTDKYAGIYAAINALQRADSLILTRVDTLRQKDAATDVVISNNLKSIANEIKIVKRFTSATRSHYLDSLLAAGPGK